MLDPHLQVEIDEKEGGLRASFPLASDLLVGNEVARKVLAAVTLNLRVAQYPPRSDRFTVSLRSHLSSFTSHDKFLRELNQESKSVVEHFHSEKKSFEW